MTPGPRVGGHLRPTRRAILARLADRDATVTELTAPLPISMPAVSRHLKVLERAALISRTRSGKWRECHLFIRPILVGGGKPALPGGLRTDLELLDDSDLGNGVVSLRYGIPN